MRPKPLLPGQVRLPRGPYGWVDLRFVTGGWLESLRPPGALLYLFFCTVGDNRGVSFWSRNRIAHLLGVDREILDEAIHHLYRAELIACDGNVVQVLPLPAPKPLTQAVSPEPCAEPQVGAEEIERQRPVAIARLDSIHGRRSHPGSVVDALAAALALDARRCLTAPSPAAASGGEARG